MELVIKGMAPKRGDRIPFVKDTVKKLAEILITKNAILVDDEKQVIANAAAYEKAKKYVADQARKLQDFVKRGCKPRAGEEGKDDLTYDHFVKKVTLNEVKDQAAQISWRVAAQIKRMDPAREPELGDRVAWIHIRIPGETSPRKTAVDAELVKKYHFPLSIDYYWEKHMEQSIFNVLEPLNAKDARAFMNRMRGEMGIMKMMPVKKSASSKKKIDPRDKDSILAHTRSASESKMNKGTDVDETMELIGDAQVEEVEIPHFPVMAEEDDTEVREISAPRIDLRSSRSSREPSAHQQPHKKTRTTRPTRTGTTGRSFGLGFDISREDDDKEMEAEELVDD